MKNFKNIMSVAMAAMAFVSCSKDADVEDPAAPEVNSRIITAVVNIDATRTSLTENRNGLQWAEGETFGVFTNNSADCNLESSGYAAGKEFTIGVSKEATEIYAYYPKSKLNDAASSTAASLAIESRQTQEQAGVLNGRFYPMTARGTIENESVRMQFTPWACALALNIYGGSADEKVAMVRFSSDVASSGVMESADLTKNVVYNATETATDVYLADAARFAPTGTKPADKQMFENQVYLVVAKTAYTNVQLEIVTTGAAGEKIYTLKAANSLDCGACDFYAMNINLQKAQVKAMTAETYPLMFSAGTGTHADTAVKVQQDGTYHMSFTSGSLNEHYALTESLFRNLEVKDNQIVELVFTYKTPTAVTADNKWQFTAMFNGNVLADCQTMKFSTASEEWITGRLNLTNAIANTKFGTDAEKSKIRFRFRMVRNSTLGINNPECPEKYGFTDIDIKDAHLEVTEIAPVDEKIALSFGTQGHANANVTTESGDVYCIQLTGNGGHGEHYAVTAPLSRQLAVTANQKVELVFTYKTPTQEQIKGDDQVVANDKWQFTTYFNDPYRGDGQPPKSEVNDSNMKLSTADEEWITYHHDLTQAIANTSFGTDATKSQIRFRIRLTRKPSQGGGNPQCPELFGFTELRVKDVYLHVYDK